MTTHTAILIGLGLYLALMFGVSLFFMLRVKRADDYLVAGRGMSSFVLGGNILATGIGTGVVIGASGLAYKSGWAGGAYPFGIGLGTIIAGFFFAVMRKHKFMTLGEEIACYYGRHSVVVNFSNIGLFMSQVCWLTVQIMGGAAVLGVVTGLPREVCTVLAGLTTAMLAIPGGLKTVIYTDFLQAGILLTGFAVLIEIALSDSGGLIGLQSKVTEAHFSLTGGDSMGPWKIGSILLALGLGIIADPGRRLSMFSAHSERGAMWAMIVSGFLVMMFAFVVGIIGMFAYSLNPDLPSSDQALPWLVINVLPAWLAAIIVVSVTSAVISSATTNAAAVGTFFVRHIYPLATGHFPKKSVTVVRKALACGFIVSTGLAFYPGSIVEFVIKFLPITMSGLAVIILLGRFWKRATWQGAITCLVSAPAVSIVIMFIPGRTGFWSEPAIPGAIAGLLSHIVVSLMSPPNQTTFDEVSELMRQQRQEIET